MTPRAPLRSSNSGELQSVLCGLSSSAHNSERIRGIAVRNRTIVIVLLRRTFAYEYDSDLRKIGEWETAENENGE